ncbi:hypothetical protein BGX38DRAFT_1142774 [Terfezia claveryi]|nr:hypothetical protein BGX38DRAFT_1142774 [Terfezia claveryi]
MKLVEIGLLQLLQGSLSLRRQLVLLLTTTNSRAKKTTRTTRAAGALAEHEGVTEALELEGTVEAMFIKAFVGSTKIIAVLVDGGSLIDQISAKVVATLGLPVFTGEGWSILLANDAVVKVNKYVWASVTVARVTARMKLYVLDIDQSYIMLLSRRWLKRVKATEEYFEHRLIIQGSDGIRRTVVGTPAEGSVVEIFQNAEENIEEEEQEDSEDIEEVDKAIEELLDELEEWEYEEDIEGEEDDTETGKEREQ